MACSFALHCVLFLGLLEYCQRYFESLRLFRQPRLHFRRHYVDVHSLHPHPLYEGAQGTGHIKRYAGLYFMPEFSDGQLN